MYDTNTFKVIALLSTYIFLKEKYNNKISKEFNQKDLEQIQKLLLQVDKYSHLPDKEKLIEECYHDILKRIENQHISETKFNDEIKNLISDCSTTDKKYILSCIVYITNIDNKISDIEWGFIRQVSNLLGLDYNKAKIQKLYKKSEFYQTRISTILLTLFIVLILSTGSIYFYYKYSFDKSVNIFNENKIIFSEISYNRYAVYKNSFISNSDHFLKQDIFFLNGVADVSVDTDRLHFNPITNNLTVSYKKTIFNIILRPNQTLFVDSIKPKPISKEEARKIGVVIGIAGAVVGGFASAKIGKFLPPPWNFIAIGGTGLVAGGAGYLATTSVLTGLKITKETTEVEKQKVINTANNLIKLILTTNPNLQKMYKKRFEQYVRYKYASINIKLNKIIYVKATK